MNRTTWSLSIAVLGLFALSAYGCSTASEADDDDTSSSSSSSGGSSSGKNGSSGNGSSSGGSSGGNVECVSIQPGTWEVGEVSGLFEASLTANGLSEPTLYFGFPLEIAMGSAVELGLNTETAVFVYTDDDTAFVAESGTATVNSYDRLTASINATLRGIKLVESNVDEDDGTTTKIDGGRCLILESADIAREGALPTPGWTCDFTWYDDGACDCGCGAADSADDCEGVTTPAQCEYCINCGGNDEDGGDCEGKVTADLLQCVQP